MDGNDTGTVAAGAASEDVDTAAPARRRLGDDRGMATVEYAIATVAAAGFAGLLLVILRSDEVRGMLLDIIRSALAFG